MNIVTTPSKYKGNPKGGRPSGSHSNAGTSVYKICAGDCDTCEHTTQCVGCMKDCFQPPCPELIKCPIQSNKLTKGE